MSAHSPALARLGFDAVGNWIPPAISETESLHPIVFAEPKRALPPRNFPIGAGDLACVQDRHVSLARILYEPGLRGYEAGLAVFVYCAFSGAHLFTAKTFRYGVSGGRLRRLPDLIEASASFSGPGAEGFAQELLSLVKSEKPIRKFRALAASLSLEAWTTQAKRKPD